LTSRDYAVDSAYWSRTGKLSGPTSTVDFAISTRKWELADGRRVVLEVDGSHHLDVGSWQADMRRERGVVIGGAKCIACYSCRNSGRAKADR
jgi:hypothetical protein